MMDLLLRRRAMMMQSSTPSDTYLTFTAEIAGVTIQLTANNTPPSISLEYNLDGGGWTAYTVGDTVTLPNIGSTLKMRGSNTTISNASGYHQFVIGGGNAAASGSVTSLLDGVGGDYPLQDYAFYRLFNGCIRLLLAPELPSTSLGVRCYSEMFKGDWYLTNIPALPATEMKQSCYHQMFDGCSRIVGTPLLPAATLAKQCYYAIFRNCQLVNYVKTYMTDISASGCLGNWLYGVAATGELHCDQSLTLTAGNSGLPSGWTRYNLDGTPYNP